MSDFKKLIHDYLVDVEYPILSFIFDRGGRYTCSTTTYSSDAFTLMVGGYLDVLVESVKIAA